MLFTLNSMLNFQMIQKVSSQLILEVAKDLDIEPLQISTFNWVDRTTKISSRYKNLFKIFLPAMQKKRIPSFVNLYSNIVRSFS